MNTNSPIPFQTIDWDTISFTEHKGETGMALWKTLQLGNLRIRLVEYSAGYKADHWCTKGHVIYCIEGSMITELSNHSLHTLEKGMCYVVSDKMSSHRTLTKNGVKLLIVDGEFLSGDDLLIRKK